MFTRTSCGTPVNHGSLLAITRWTRRRNRQRQVRWWRCRRPSCRCRWRVTAIIRSLRTRISYDWPLQTRRRRSRSSRATVAVHWEVRNREEDPFGYDRRRSWPAVCRVSDGTCVVAIWVPRKFITDVRYSNHPVKPYVIRGP